MVVSIIIFLLYELVGKASIEDKRGIPLGETLESWTARERHSKNTNSVPLEMLWKWDDA